MSKSISGLFTSTTGAGRELINELVTQGVKINVDDVVAITEDSLGKIVWLENGHLGKNASGLKHIIAEHEDQFTKQGILVEEIPRYLMAAVKYGNIVDYQGKGTGRPIYEFSYEGKLRRVAITIADNGYIVGANPKSIN